MAPMIRRYPLLALGAALAMAIARAWTCDDAFITFRVVDQWFAGNGPVFNAGERVQVFTHPLWLLVLCAWHGLRGSLFPGAMALSLAIFAAGLALFYLAFRDKPLGLALAFAFILLSRTMADFATSGLETPLSFALFAGAIFAIRTGRDRWAVVALALLPLVRLDLSIWMLPLAAIVAARGRVGRLGLATALASPAVAWMAISTVYYGSPLPNTAFAKLGGTVAGRLDSGIGYVAASFASDPAALALLVAAPAIGGWRWRRRDFDRQDGALAAASAASALIAILYAAWAGGDFMLGRFVLPALWALWVLLLASMPAQGDSLHARRAAAFALAALALFHLVTGHSANNLWIGLEEKSLLRAVGFAGATDERRVYIPWLGAYAPNRLVVKPDGLPLSPRPRVVAMLGQNGFLARNDQAFDDIHGLSDPFLARIAPLDNGRPGHPFRPLPPDYDLWRDPGHRFDDERLEALARDARLVHRSAELFSAQRFAAVLRLLQMGTLPSGALSVADEGDAWRIEMQPAKLYRPGAAASYLVWIRRYDPGHIGYFSEFPRGLDAHCHPVEMPPDRREEAALEVAAGEGLTLRCAKRDIGRDGILVRIGARAPGGERVSYDEIIPVVRPLFGWTSGIGDWLVEGWTEKPRPAAAVALVLAIAALLLWRGALPGRPPTV